MPYYYASKAVHKKPAILKTGWYGFATKLYDITK